MNFSDSTNWVILGGGFLTSHFVDYAEFNKIPYTVIERSQCDFCDENQVRRALSYIQPGAILLIPVAQTRLRGNTAETLEINVRMIKNIVLSVPDHVRHIIYFSTIDVYGVNPNPSIKETDPLVPDDYYSLSKCVGEFMVERELTSRCIPHTILRLSGLYGNRDDGKSTLSHMRRSLIAERKIRLTGDPEIERDFVWTPDIPKLIKQIVEKGIQGIYNVATGKSHSLLQIANLVSKQIDGGSVEVSISHSGGRAKILRFDMTKLLHKIPDFEFTPLEMGINQYFRFK